MADSSIKLFQFLQKFCRAFGINSPQPNQKRYHISPINWTQLFGLNEYLVSTTAFILFEANSMAEYGITFFICSCIIACNIWCLTAFWQVANIPRSVGNWEKFIEKRVDSTIEYEDANEIIERLTKWFAYWFLASFLLNIFSALIYTVVNYCILDSREESSFFLMSPVWYPFNWRTPLGYCVAWLGQFGGCSTIMVIFTLFFCFFFGTSFLFICMAEDITKDMTAFNHTLSASENRDRDRMELMERFCAIIQIYSDAKQCVSEFNQINEYILFLFFAWGMLSLCFSLVSLQFQLWDDDSRLMELCFTSVLIFCTFVLIFLICEPGKWVTDRFDLFGKELEKCDWNKLPIELQRIFLIFLLNIQQPVHIRSFGGLICSRETFKEITNKGFSYFMMLRQFKI